jgi:hypothetical protein
LYFRGKQAYASRFARPPRGAEGALVMTSSRGLLGLETLVTRDDLLEFDTVRIDPDEPRYATALERSAKALAARLPPRTEVVLLGSIATEKYTGILLPVFGDQLLFPKEFVGRGDMSRGGLMLRSVDVDHELDYISVRGAVRNGKRAPKLGAQRKAGLRARR